MTLPEISASIWPVLVRCARERRTITYGKLGEEIGHPARGMGRCLDPIHEYCRHHNLPALTVLVVRKGEGTPGDGFQSADDLKRETHKVWDFDWQETGSPTPEMLKVFIRNPTAWKKSASG